MTTRLVIVRRIVHARIAAVVATIEWSPETTTPETTTKATAPSPMFSLLLFGSLFSLLSLILSLLGMGDGVDAADEADDGEEEEVEDGSELHC